MKTKLSVPLVAALSAAMMLCLATGCSSVGRISGQTDTNVQLSQNNYRTVMAGARGKSYGFNLLGIIPIVSPNYADAKANLYKSVGVPLTGKAVTLANQTEDRSSLYLILFSIPRVTITADVIEFTGEGNRQAQPVQSAAPQ
jgi:predicted transcriptional regulator